MLTNSELKIWLIPNPSNGKQCYCKYCEKVVKASNQKDLQKHGKSPNHVDAAERAKGQVKLTDVCTTNPEEIRSRLSYCTEYEKR